MTEEKRKHMRPVQGYECGICGFLTVDSDKFDQHNLLPSPRKKLEKGTLLMSICSSRWRESIVIDSSKVGKDHGNYYMTIGFPELTPPLNNRIKRSYNQTFADHYRIPTKEEFEIFERDHLEELMELGVKPIRITEQNFRELTSR